jgi:hypothetical protein
MSIAVMDTVADEAIDKAIVEARCLCLDLCMMAVCLISRPIARRTMS